MVARSDRVKGVELHPTEPWLLANLYNGNVYIWNYNDSVSCCQTGSSRALVRALVFGLRATSGRGARGRQKKSKPRRPSRLTPPKPTTTKTTPNKQTHRM